MEPESEHLKGPLEKPLESPLESPLKKPLELQIDHGIPIPKIKQWKPREPRYPFHRMKVGDSFLSQKGRAVVSTAAIQFVRRKAPDWRFTIRTTTKGIRCWRIK